MLPQNHQLGSGWIRGNGPRVGLDIVHVQRPAGDTTVHVKFLQVVPNRLVADDVHVAKCARPVVVTAQYFVVRQFPAPIGIGPLVALHRAAVRGVHVGQINDVSVGE